MLPGRAQFFFVHQHLKRTAEPLSRLVGFDDIVEVAEGRGLVRIGEGLLEILGEAFPLLVRISGVSDASRWPRSRRRGVSRRGG